jgi:hypothetical protein
MSGVTIGDGACIAANSHIVKNVEPYSVVGGDPATFIKYRFSPEIIEYLLRLQWWNLSIELINELSPFLCSDDFKALQNKVIELKIL